MMDLFETVRTNDFVEYFVLLTNNKSTSSNEIQEIYNSLMSFVTPLIENYIWHKEEFSISKVIPTSTGNESCYLHGILHFGENIEDEWFVVYLLKLFSKKCRDIFVKVTDSDGEFLLIEASNSLPKWLQSDTCNCQTYIYDGVVRFVPGKFSTQFDAITKTAAFLRRPADALEAEKNVTSIIEKKVERFANGVTEFLHQSRVCLPAKVAALLDAKPSLIASAITAYCERDIIDKKICKTMKHFPPEQLVLRSIKFTKFLYAMISHEKIESNSKQTNWTIPSPAEANFKERILGLKITSGFEILASKYKNNPESELTVNKKWLQYVDVLHRKGYFKDFLAGSKNYRNLENQARKFFLENTDATKSDSHCILNILPTISYDYEAMKREESCLPPSDEEQWMIINEEHFDDYLRERYDCPDSQPVDSPEAVSAALNTFLNQLSDIEGVEVRGESEDLDSMDSEADHLIRGITFDADGFLPTLEKMMDKMAVENNIGVNGEVLSDDSDLESDNGSATDEDSNASEEIDIKSYMQLMDKELQDISLFEKEMSNVEDVCPGGIPNFDSDIHTNILKSYEEQCGASGPAGNILQSLGLRLKSKKED